MTRCSHRWYILVTFIRQFNLSTSKFNLKSNLYFKPLCYLPPTGRVFISIAWIKTSDENSIDVDVFKLDDYRLRGSHSHHYSIRSKEVFHFKYGQFYRLSDSISRSLRMHLKRRLFRLLSFLASRRLSANIFNSFRII